MGSLVMGMICSKLMKDGKPVRFSTGPDPKKSKQIEHYLAFFWHWMFEPLLFSLIGAAVKFRQIEFSVIPKALLILLTSLTTVNFFLFHNIIFFAINFL